MRKLESCESRFLVTRVPPGRPSHTNSGTRTTGWNPCTSGTRWSSRSYARNFHYFV